MMVWYSHLFKSFPQFIMIHTVKAFLLLFSCSVLSNSLQPLDCYYSLLLLLYMTTIALTILDLCRQSNVIAFLIHCLGLLWILCQGASIFFRFVARVTIYSDLEPKKRKSVTTSTFLLSICHAVMGPDAMILVCLFVCLFCLNPTLSLSSFILIKRLFSSSSLSAIRVLSSTHLRLLMFLLPILISACDSSSSTFLMRCSV